MQFTPPFIFTPLLKFHEGSMTHLHNKFYPTFSGVAQSYNYYPVSHMKRKQGVAFVALGLGKTIADGEKSLRYCPSHPEILPQYYSIKSTLNNTQNNFYALNLNKGKNPLKYGESENLNQYDLSVAENDKELNHIASVIINEDNIIRESLKYDGPRVLTFSSIIKYDYCIGVINVYFFIIVF